VAAVAFPLPDNLKLRDGKGKWLLRRWLAARQPEAKAFAPKRGFTVPVADWIGRKGARLGPLVASQPGIAEACLADAVKSLFGKASGRRQGFAAWVLLFYALWHHQHILGHRPDGDVFDVLSA
jgi:asparagine synthase (glutamine-hydrolysing)